MSHAKPVRLETAPTGPGGNIELPNYFLKTHLVCVMDHNLTDRGTEDHFYEVSF